MRLLMLLCDIPLLLLLLLLTVQTGYSRVIDRAYGCLLQVRLPRWSSAGLRRRTYGGIALQWLNLLIVVVASLRIQTMATA